MNNKGLSPVVAVIILIAVTVAVSIAVVAWMEYTSTDIKPSVEAGYYVEGIVIFVEKEWSNTGNVPFIKNTIVHFEDSIVSDAPKVNWVNPELSNMAVRFQGDYDFQIGWEYKIHYGANSNKIGKIEVMQK